MFAVHYVSTECIFVEHVQYFKSKHSALAFIRENSHVWVDFWVDLDGKMLDTAEFVFNKKIVEW